jgi:6-phosphogluconolactonase (cycloisomerase 2 family)
MFAYVGSRTTRERNARGDGISVYRCVPASGVLELVQVHGDLVNPSFLALNKAGDRLYSVHGDCEEISAFVVDRITGRIEFLNRQSTQGKNPVHLALDPTERFVVVSNHISSSLAVLPIEANGALGELTQLLKIEGEPGPHRKEQPFAKPHFNPFDPSGHFVVVPDKGLDKTLVFRFENGQLTPAAFPEALGREASGPRHLAFHPGKPWVYIANELDSTVTACRLDAATGQLTPFQIVSGLADSYTGNSRISEIEVHPSGKTLYVSNRGEDTIGVFSIYSATGRISLIQSMQCGGKTPRFFSLTPDGHFMHVLNEDSDSIVTLSVDAQSGMLSETGQSQSCGSPVCMVYST